jgi:hypothetical protein
MPSSPMPPRFNDQIIRPTHRRISKYSTFTQIALFVALLCMADIATNGAVQQSLLPITSTLQDTLNQVQLNSSGLFLAFDSKAHSQQQADGATGIPQVSSNILMAIAVSMLVFLGGNYLKFSSSSAAAKKMDNMGGNASTPSRDD